jgi:hypothetical protein
MALTDQLNQSTDYVNNVLAPLSEEQLNWRSTPATWSVAQCVDHLVVNNIKYFTIFDRIANGSYQQTTWQSISPFTGFLEKKLLQFTAAVAEKKVKAPPSFSPSASLIDKDIIQRFLQQQEKLIQYFILLEPIANNKKIIISSPFSSLVTFRLNILLTALANHEQRHINQVDTILHHPQFPKA